MSSRDRKLGRVGSGNRKIYLRMHSCFPRGIKFSLVEQPKVETPPKTLEDSLAYIKSLDRSSEGSEWRPEWRGFSRDPERERSAMAFSVRESTKNYHYRALVEQEEVNLALPMIRRIKTEIPIAQQFLEKLDAEAKKHLEQHFRPEDIEIEFSHARKIKETLADCFSIGHLYGVEWKDMCHALTPVLIANEAVYALDDVYDNSTDNSNNGFKDALNRRSETYAFLWNYIADIGREDLWTDISKMFTSVEALFMMEKKRDIDNPKTKMLLKQVGQGYGKFFEPSDIFYMDTGTHMVLSLEQIRGKVPNKEEFESDLGSLKRYCNASRRITDVGDCMLDLRKDVKNQILCPFGFYTYFLCTPEERDVILNTITSGIYSEEMEKIIKAYAQRTIKDNTDYILSISPNSERSEKVQERFLKLGDIILEMAEDTENGRRSYNNFYNQTISRLMMPS